MEDINELKKRQTEINPGFGSYLECMTRALFTGLASFGLAFSGTYIGQTLVKNRLPYGKKSFVLVSGLFAAGVSYQVTSTRTKSCQAAWMAAEDKHTFLKDKEEEQLD